MGNKIVCLDCRKSFSQGTNFENRKELDCPNCGRKMILLPHRFRPPKKTDNKKWEVVKFLIENGFYYQHIYEKIETKNEVAVAFENYVVYPENMREAIEFVEKYKSQVL